MINLLKMAGASVASAVAGGLIAWTANSLTVAGELRQLTRAVQRIELRLDYLSRSGAPADSAVSERGR